MSSAIAMAVEPSTTPSNDQKQASISPVTKPPTSPKDEIQAVARKVSCEPLQNPDPSAWAVLTAISTNARRRSQGMNILLIGDEHCLGRCVDAHFQIIATSISGSHCKIYKEKVVPADNSSMHVFLKDTSTNGTYHNWVKLKKGSPSARLRHGDIISFVLPPHDDKSYAFVYREIHKSINLANGVVAKRKPEEYGPESKRLKGIGIGAAEGPILPVPKPPASPKDEIQAVAHKVSCEPLQNPDPRAWAVLTAISTNARRRFQGMNILLRGDEHCLGRCVNTHFQILATSISGSHCKIFKEKVVPAENSSIQVFLKDTSTNGTYHNWVKLKKGSPSESARLRHGDIISLVFPPHDDKSYAFVYREIHKSINLANGVVAKRKPEEYGPESKRLKGIGIGAAEGPISLDDVRRLQRSNTELRQQLESHVLTIETLHSENRESIARHENEVKMLKENISNPYLAQIKESLHAIDMKQKQLDELNTCSAELRNSIEDLNEKLGASMQSRVDADEIIKSQKVTISDLEAQLEEERNQRRGEREKAEVDLKSALQRAHSEAVAEIKRHTDDYLKQRREQQEVISKLQESEKESRLLAETLRSKLEDVRESLVLSEKRVRQREVHMQDEQIASTNNKKKSETLESELKRLRNELESEKVAREEARAKVSALELEIAAAIRDLSIEKQRFQGAREKLILRETQLRAFYSTTEEISALFKKQQEQLKSMQKTLEDEDNYENASIGPNPNDPAEGNADVAHVATGEAANTSNRTREACSTLIPKSTRAVDISSDNDDDDVSTTEKHDCSMRIQDGGDTQDLECTNADRSYKGFDPTIDAVGEAVVPDGGPTDTERVLETESPRELGDNNQAGETMQLDIETQAQENLEPAEKAEDNRAGLHSQSRLENTEPGMIRTVDLLSSEVAGSWAVSTAPSFHGENESPRCMGDDAGALGEDMTAAETMVPYSEGEGQVAGSQNNVTHRAAKMSKEHRKLNTMIEIVAPDFRQQFQDGAGSGDEKSGSTSCAETEESSGGSDDNNLDENQGMIEDSVG